MRNPPYHQNRSGINSLGQSPPSIHAFHTSLYYSSEAPPIPHEQPWFTSLEAASVEYTGLAGNPSQDNLTQDELEEHITSNCLHQFIHGSSTHVCDQQDGSRQATCTSTTPSINNRCKTVDESFPQASPRAPIPQTPETQDPELDLPNFEPHPASNCAAPEDDPLSCPRNPRSRHNRHSHQRRNSVPDTANPNEDHSTSRSKSPTLRRQRKIVRLGLRRNALGLATVRATCRQLRQQRRLLRQEQEQLRLNQELIEKAERALRAHEHSIFQSRDSRHWTSPYASTSEISCDDSFSSQSSDLSLESPYSPLGTPFPSPISYSDSFPLFRAFPRSRPSTPQITRTPAAALVAYENAWSTFPKPRNRTPIPYPTTTLLPDPLAHLPPPPGLP
ncbi:hypothetical protein MMC12_000547 [Toensbergia leucococca]|nr:hypothetical protein [Toensbergia leucococca]